MAAGTPEMEQKNQDIVKAIETHIEPLLYDAKPFFGGSQNVTLAEVSSICSWSLKIGRELGITFAGANGIVHSPSLRLQRQQRSAAS